MCCALHNAKPRLAATKGSSLLGPASRWASMRAFPHALPHTPPQELLTTSARWSTGELQTHLTHHFAIRCNHVSCACPYVQIDSCEGLTTHAWPLTALQELQTILGTTVKCRLQIHLMHHSSCFGDTTYSQTTSFQSAAWLHCMVGFAHKMSSVPCCEREAGGTPVEIPLCPACTHTYVCNAAEAASLQAARLFKPAC